MDYKVFGVMKSIRSVAKKVYNLNLKAYKEGKKNFLDPNPYDEELAVERSEICRVCEKNEHEPIEELRIADTRIPSISDRMCDECGCSLPYLLRQSIKKCPLKKW